MPGAAPMSSEDVLRQEVPWAAFQSAGIVTREQLELIYSMDDQPVTSQVALFHAKGTAVS